MRLQIRGEQQIGIGKGYTVQYAPQLISSTCQFLWIIAKTGNVSAGQRSLSALMWFLAPTRTWRPSNRVTTYNRVGGTLVLVARGSVGEKLCCNLIGDG